MIGSMHVLDVLRERGYEPQEDADAGESWFDLRAGQATVRAILTDEGDAEIHAFTGPFVCQWSVRFSSAPGAVFLATLDAAEREAGIRQVPTIAKDYAATHPIVCAHADEDGQGSHVLAPGEKCTREGR